MTKAHKVKITYCADCGLRVAHETSKFANAEVVRELREIATRVAA